jgi:uncharacterized protein YggU (UPF0235/DUF167 family)
MYLKVVVHPSAKRELVVEKSGALQISVKEPAQGNHANTRVRELVALRLKVPLAKVRIISGHHSRSKMLSILE